MQQTFASASPRKCIKAGFIESQDRQRACALNRSADDLDMNDDIVESFSRKSLGIGTRKTVTIYLNVAGTLMFLAHPATERSEARESKSVAPSRRRTPRQDHSRKSTLSRRSAKTKWLSDPSPEHLRTIACAMAL